MVPTPSSDDLMDRVFKGLKIQFPTFYKGFNEKEVISAKKFWAIKLKAFDEEQVLKTLMKASDLFDNTPKVGDFVKACRVNPAHKAYKNQLPPPVHSSKRDLAARMFANRIMKGEFVKYPESADKEIIDFINSMNIPETSDLKEHQVCWTNMFMEYARRFGK